MHSQNNPPQSPSHRYFAQGCVHIHMVGGTADPTGASTPGSYSDSHKQTKYYEAVAPCIGCCQSTQGRSIPRAHHAPKLQLSLSDSRQLLLLPAHTHTHTQHNLWVPLFIPTHTYTPTTKRCAHPYNLYSRSIFGSYAQQGQHNAVSADQQARTASCCAVHPAQHRDAFPCVPLSQPHEVSSAVRTQTTYTITATVSHSSASTMLHQPMHTPIQHASMSGTVSCG